MQCAAVADIHIVVSLIQRIEVNGGAHHIIFVALIGSVAVLAVQRGVIDVDRGVGGLKCRTDFDHIHFSIVGDVNIHGTTIAPLNIMTGHVSACNG